MPVSITIQGAGTTVATAGSGSITLDEPTGTAQGDLVVAMISRRGTATMTTPSGWTEVINTSAANSTVNTTASKSALIMAYYIRGASPPASFVFAQTGGDVAVGKTFAYRCSTGSWGYLGASSFVNTTAITTISTTGFTTSYENTLLVSCVAGARPTGSNTFSSADPGGDSGSTVMATSIDPTNAWLLRVNTTTSAGSDAALSIAETLTIAPGITGDISASTPQALNAIGVVAFHVPQPKSGVKNGGVWKDFKSINIKDSGVWKPATAGYVKDESVWKPFFTDPNAVYNDNSGASICVIRPVWVAQMSSPASYTFVASVGTPAPHRVIVILISGNASVAPSTLTSVTIGGVTATLTHNGQTGANSATWCAARVPAGAAVEVVVTGGLTTWLYASVWSIYGGITSLTPATTGNKNYSQLQNHSLGSQSIPANYGISLLQWTNSSAFLFQPTWDANYGANMIGTDIPNTQELSRSYIINDTGSAISRTPTAGHGSGTTSTIAGRTAQFR